MSQKRVLILDDEPKLANHMAHHLHEAGYPSDPVTSAAAFLQALRERPYWAAILDLELGPGAATVRQTYELFRELYPDLQLPHEEVLADLPELDPFHRNHDPRPRAREDSEATGYYLLPMLKAITPGTAAIIVTANFRPESMPFLRRWGSYDVTEKGAPNSVLSRDGKDFRSILGEILGTLAGIDGRSPEPLSTTSIPPAVEELRAVLDTHQGSSDLKELLKAYVEVWPPDHGAKGEILYFNESQRLLEQIAVFGFESTLEVMKVRSLQGEVPEEAGLCAFAARTKESVLAPHVRYDRRYRPVAQSDSTQSELVVPLLLQGRVVGVLNLEARLPNAFRFEHLQYFQSIGPQLALRIEHETFRVEEEFIRNAIQRISSLSERDQILEQVLESVLSELAGSASMGCVLLPVDDPSSPQTLEVVASRGLELQAGDRREVASLGVIRNALISGADHRYWPQGDEAEGDYVQLAEGVNSEYVRVLRVGADVVAVLDIESRHMAISERFQRAVERLATHASALIAGLQERSRRERDSAVGEVLTLLGHETHIAGGALGLILDPGSPPSSVRDLGAVVLERLYNVPRIVESYLREPVPLPLARVLTGARDAANPMGVELHLPEDLSRFPTVMAVERGLQWLLDNLLLNTRQHTPPRGGSEPRWRAWIDASGEGLLRQLRYWDDGTAPDNAASILDSARAGRGMRDIARLCQRLGWKPSTGVAQNGSLEYTFEFTCLPEVRA